MSPLAQPPNSEPSPEDEGARLMLKVRAGDGDAFADLVRRYHRTVLNAVFRYCGNRATAEELTQDVFVRVYRARDGYEVKAKFETWLYRIIFNLCANAADYGKRRRAISLDRASAGHDGDLRSLPVNDPDAEDPLDRLEQDELSMKLRDCIGRLPDQQRAALIMSRWGGVQYTTIAESLDTTVEAVKSLLFRARENLRQMLLPYLREEVREEAHDGR